jgi:hypothetical protein
MKTGAIQNLICVLDQAFEKLNTNITIREIEDLAVAVHRSLSVETRRFHTPEHVFSLTDPSAPIRSLAAVFHDLIYYQADECFPSHVYSIVAPYLLETDKGGLIVETTPAADRSFELLRDLFVISPAKAISTTTDINEFFSALVAWKRLEHVLSETLLLKIAAHIEATIPFRGQDENNVAHFDVLAERLKKIGLTYDIPLTNEEVIETIQSAVMFANQDVAGFANPDPAVFLDNTWKLLPEVNAELRSGRIYSICEYRQALQKMEAFFARLEPQNIFHSYKGVPTEKDLQQLTAAAHRNIDIAREYLGVKLLAIAVIEALAEITGGDAPLALFMGDIQVNGELQQRLENYLPIINPLISLKLNPAVHQLLKEGRSGQSLFDLQNAPLALYLYKCLGSAGCEALLSAAREMFAEKRNPTDYLGTIDQSVISAIAHACAQMVPTRKDLLNHFVSV